MTRLDTPTRNVIRFSVLATAVALAVACHKEEPPAPAAGAPTPAASATVAAAPAAARAKPDFGGVSSEHVEATGAGPTLDAAVDHAIRIAIEQVNGKTMAAGSSAMNYVAQVEANGARLDVTSSQYADWLASHTQGAVSHFRILSQQQVNQPTSSDEEHLAASKDASWSKGSIDASAERNAEAHAAAGDAAVDATANEKASVSGDWDVQQGASKVDYNKKHTEFGTHWEVKIAADVATYHEAAGAKLTRVVVALPRSDQTTYRVGDSNIPADAIGGQIRTSLSNALVQTHRFTVLDRDATAEISQEIELINSGNAKREDTARLGQQLATDLIVIPSIDRFEYLRHERQLRLSDRTLASYTGGGALSFRVVNAATGQLVLAQSFKYTLPDTAPTTLGASADGPRLAALMMDTLDGQIVHAIMQNTYPLTVLQANGNKVVINQGGDNVIPGTTYEAVTMGDEVTDPQSGLSLGRAETPCCTVMIDRVTPNMSYGHIAEEGIDTSGFKPGAMELRDAVIEAAAPKAKSVGGVVPARGDTSAKPKNAKVAAEKPAGEDKNW
jgi:hypothetical protein